MMLHNRILTHEEGLDWRLLIQPAAGLLAGLFPWHLRRPFVEPNQTNLTVLTLILHRVGGTQGKAGVCNHACAVETLWQWSRHNLKCESSPHLSIWRPLSLLICILQQVHQPSALINACLSDTALNLPPTLLCVCVYHSLGLVDLFAPRGAPLMWQHNVGQAWVTAGQRRPGWRGN